MPEVTYTDYRPIIGASLPESRYPRLFISFLDVVCGFALSTLNACLALRSSLLLIRRKLKTHLFR